MRREIGTGVQDFEKLRVNNDFYVDKTDFIKNWWQGNDDVTLITRPRRFGKTLNMSTLNCFFSNKYANRPELFEGLRVWEDPDMRLQQGKWPVIFLSFAGIKETTYASTMIKMKKVLVQLFSAHPELYQTDKLDKNEQIARDQIREEMRDEDASMSPNLLTTLLGRKSCYFWMNMIRRCRKHISTDTGMIWWLLRGACSTTRLRRIPSWNGGS